MYCPKYGTLLAEDAVFCVKCGTRVEVSQSREASPSTMPILAPLEAKSLKCPHCGAPIAPKFGEMIITC